MSNQRQFRQTIKRASGSPFDSCVTYVQGTEWHDYLKMNLHVNTESLPNSDETNICDNIRRNNNTTALDEPITPDEVAASIGQLHKHQAPGPD